jgi:hypothetical protein
MYTEDKENPGQCIESENVIYRGDEADPQGDLSGLAKYGRTATSC